MCSKIRFETPESIDTHFILRRPSFKAGEIDKSQTRADPMPRKIRNGLGNRDIRRKNFLAPKIRPRNVSQFPKYQTSTIDIPAEKTSSLGYETTIRVPDPTDFEYLRERERLKTRLVLEFKNAGIPESDIPALVDRELEINKPFGREQRTITKKVDNIAGYNQLKTDTKLKEIFQEIKEGKAENLETRRALMEQILIVFSDVRKLGNISAGVQRDLNNILKMVGFNGTRESAGINTRFVDIDYYKANQGIVNLLLINRANQSSSEAYNVNLPCRDWVKNKRTGFPAISLITMINSMIPKKGKNTSYIDLDRFGRVSFGQMLNAVGETPGGVASPDFSGLSVSIKNKLAERPEEEVKIE